MTAIRRIRDVGAERAQRIIVELGRDIRDARRLAGLSQEQVARAAGISHSHLSRIEHGRVPGISIELASRIAAAVGLDLSVRTFPGGIGIRDLGQVRLLGRFRALIAPSIKGRTEVPVGSVGDSRAWDDVLVANDRRAGVEAETHVRDWQALDRKIALRRRDSGIQLVILVLADTRHHRAVLREIGPAGVTNFPEPARSALATLRAGSLPAASTIVLV
ncbi:MAG TPA: helix-turn-helix transcriptional regulator [Candidatus Limnocylindrales bacterium]|nr:helix-turn-helix transcriptional regulator [Candidatus Limnocylindrales bacterium]